MENEVLGNNNPIECSNIANINNDDYASCEINFDASGSAKITLIGKGKFEGLKIVNGTKDNLSAVESTESTTEVKPAGKRGRPKKVEAEVEQPAKKSVGRPKKQVEEKQETKPISRPKKELKPTEINDIDAFLKEIDDEIAKENAKLEASKIQLAKNAKIKNKKRK